MSSFLLRRATAVSAGAARSFSTSSPRSVARIHIIGNLADTPEVQATSTGREVIRYAVASNHGPSSNRQTSWFRITSFADGPKKDFLLSLPKGCMVYIDGDATMNTFQDANGQTRSNLSVLQRNIEILKRPQAPAQTSEESEATGQNE